MGLTKIKRIGSSFVLALCVFSFSNVYAEACDTSGDLRIINETGKTLSDVEVYYQTGVGAPFKCDKWSSIANQGHVCFNAQTAGGSWDPLDYCSNASNRGLLHLKVEGTTLCTNLYGSSSGASEVQIVVDADGATKCEKGG